MIAGCPKCGARYRVEREKLSAGGVRLRCARCEAVFRVRAPEADPEAGDRTQVQLGPISAAAAPPARPPVERPAPQPAALPVAKPVAAVVAAAAAPSAAPQARAASGDLVLIAIPEAAVAKQLADTLAARGVRTIVAHDGVEAVLELQRQLPKAAVVAAHLPKMFGFQVCELVKRNESLRGTWIVLAGAIHNPERYRRPARDTYGADAYLEAPDLPDGAIALLRQGGVAIGEPAQRSAPRPVASAPAPPRAPAPVAAPARPRASDGLDEQRAKAERLARIIVSDIVLYNEQKFAEAIRNRNVAEALDGDLAEGRHLFQERIDARVRGERDYLSDELLRVAKQRGMK